MMVMARSRVFVGRVALQADPLPRRAQSGGVRLVAIAAGDAGGEHPALLERAVIVDLVLHLAVGMVEAAREQRDDMGVGQCPPGNPGLRKFAAARVAEAAGLDLLAGECWRIVARGVARARIDRPTDVAPLVEPDQ